MNYKYLILSLFFASNLTFASEVNLTKYFEAKKETSVLTENLYVRNELAATLGHDYQKFLGNFEVYHSPYRLKNAKAVYIEGTKSKSKDASAATIYDDGRIYVASYDVKNNTVSYFTNDKSCSTTIHPAIKVFVSHYPSAKVKIVKKTGFKYIGTSQSCTVKSMVYSQSKIVASDTPKQAATRAVAEKIWNASIADSLDVNEEVGVVVSKAVNAISTCSYNFNLVPKPPTWNDGFFVGRTYFIKPGLDYIEDYLKEIIPYLAGVKQAPTYQSCIVVTSANYRSELELASLGI